MPLKRKSRQGTDVIYGRVRLPNGRIVERRCPTWNAAIAWEEAAKLENPDTSKTDTVSLLALFSMYLDHVQARGMASKTYSEKQLSYKPALAALGAHTPVVKVTYAAMEAHLNAVSMERGGALANRHRKNLIAAYNWGVKSLGLPAPCPWHVDRYKEDKEDKYVPSVEDFWRVYDHGSQLEQRVLLAMLHTAGRKMEILRLRWKDVDMQRKVISLGTRKRSGGGMEYDKVPMTEELHAVLREQRLLTGFNEHVFVTRLGKPYTSASRTMERLCKRAGVKPFGFHAIRHLSASILDAAGYPLTVIQAILRHRSARTTSIYLRALRGERVALDNAYRRTESESASESPLTGTHSLMLKALK